MKNRVRCLLLLLALYSGTVLAALTPDYVTLGGQQWAQARLFGQSGVKRSDIDAVCPSGLCTGELNGYDLTGWSWASSAEVGDWLFGPYTPHPGGAADYMDNDITWAQNWFINTGFLTNQGTKLLARTRDDFAYTSLGWDTSGAFALSSLSNTWNPAICGDNVICQDILSQLDVDAGAWFYRQFSVPEPDSLLLISLGLAGLFFARRVAM